MLQELKPSWLVWCQLTWIDLDSNGSGRESRDGFEFTVGLVCFLPYYVIILYIYNKIHHNTSKNYGKALVDISQTQAHDLMSCLAFTSFTSYFVCPARDQVRDRFCSCSPMYLSRLAKRCGFTFFWTPVAHRMSCHVMSCPHITRTITTTIWNRRYIMFIQWLHK